jgi:carbon storage regulator
LGNKWHKGTEAPMLVLTRKLGEQLVVGDNVVISVQKISRSRATLGIEAPAEVSVIRQELIESSLPERRDRRPADVPRS